MTDQKPETERNYREEAIAATARVCAGDVTLVRNAAKRGARDIYGFAVEQCAARLELADLNTRLADALEEAAFYLPLWPPRRFSMMHCLIAESKRVRP